MYILNLIYTTHYNTIYKRSPVDIFPLPFEPRHYPGFFKIGINNRCIK